MQSTIAMPTQEPTVPSGWCYNSSLHLIVHAQRMLLHVLSHFEPDTTPPLATITGIIVQGEWYAHLGESKDGGIRQFPLNFQEGFLTFICPSKAVSFLACTGPRDTMSFRFRTTSGYSMTLPIMASNADYEETRLLLLFEP